MTTRPILPADDTDEQFLRLRLPHDIGIGHIHLFFDDTPVETECPSGSGYVQSRFNSA
jgi:hypothetical protein